MVASALILASFFEVPSRFANAALDRPVSWPGPRAGTESSVDLDRALQAQYASSGNLLNPAVESDDLQGALKDELNRIYPDFKVPPQLRNSVAFWLKIYTVYTTHHVVLFDARHPEVIYGVLDFRDLARTAKNAVVYEILRERRVNATVAAYKAAFARLARNSKRRRSSMTLEEQNILAAIKGARHRHSFREMAQNFHTQTGQRDNVIRGLVAAEVYFPKMERIFVNMSLPPQLARLSLVESSFDLSAHSYAGAQGIWQFMPGPGSHYLTISDKAGIDERLSPLKSTVAAAKLLRENYRRFNNWALAITSYNHGLKGLMKFKGSERVRDFRQIASLFDPCSKNSPLGWAGRNYFAEFLAMVHAEAYRDRFYGIPPITPLRALTFTRLDKRRSLISLATQHGISINEIRKANPDVRSVNQTLPRGFVVALPSDWDDLADLTPTSVRSKVKLSKGRKDSQHRAKS